VPPVASYTPKSDHGDHSLNPGDQLGPYQIAEHIGAGGMGEVYKAHDPRMGRDVAIKIAAERFSERFSREVHAVAALNHPNVCHLYDVGPNYLVMELVEGPTLAERLQQGAIPIEEALQIAKQIADGLEAAHDKNIIHRDLKPGNIKLKPDGVVKVLDFGLAKIGPAYAGESQAEARPTESPTLTIGATQAGMILGTAAYMSPEQARGKTVNKRADIWAFGVVLYEMLAGRRLFEGEDVSEVLAQVITKEPDWDLVPEKARRLLRRCLRKDPRKRLRDIGDAMELVEDATAPTAPSRSRFSAKGWIAAAVLFVVAGVALPFALAHLREKPAVAEPVRFQIAAPGKTSFENYVAPSPDGRRLVFTATGADGRPSLWVRALDSLEARLLPGTENAGGPFWSPDSRFIAFGDGNKLKKVDVTGGPPITLCEVQNTVGSGAWSQDGVIVFGGRGAGALQRVSAAGGVAAPVTVLDPLRQEGFHSFPSFLPDGRHFIYFRTSVRADSNGIYMGSLDAKPEQQATKRLLAVQYGAAYIPTADSAVGRLLFLREGTLMTQPVDNRRLELVGEPVPIAEQVSSNNTVQGRFGVSPAGVLAYRTGLASGGTSLTWYDRQGKVLGAAAELAPYATVALSPDGTRMAVTRGDPQNANLDIWLIEFARATSTRFTFDPAPDGFPVWSPDGSRIIFRSNRNGPGDLYQKAASGAGSDEVLFKSPEPKTPSDWSGDGRFLLYSVADPKTKNDLWILPLQGDRKPVPYLKTEFNETQGQFSPDSRFIAYRSDESGQSEIYVQPFPMASGGGGKWMVSRGGGAQPRWRRDGKELFYIARDRMVMAVDISTSPAFKAEIPKALFESALLPAGATVFRWDVSADGKRFLLNTLGTDAASAAQPPITVVLNWQAGLK
jgi:eukaryotic-like serine/threonine-protein kinase